MDDLDIFERLGNMKRHEEMLSQLESEASAERLTYSRARELTLDPSLKTNGDRKILRDSDYSQRLMASLRKSVWIPTWKILLRSLRDEHEEKVRASFDQLGLHELSEDERNLLKDHLGPDGNRCPQTNKRFDFLRRGIKIAKLAGIHSWLGEPRSGYIGLVQDPLSLTTSFANEIVEPKAVEIRLEDIDAKATLYESKGTVRVGLRVFSGDDKSQGPWTIILSGLSETGRRELESSEVILQDEGKRGWYADHDFGPVEAVRSLGDLLTIRIERSTS